MLAFRLVFLQCDYTKNWGDVHPVPASYLSPNKSLNASRFALYGRAVIFSGVGMSALVRRALLVQVEIELHRGAVGASVEMEPGVRSGPGSADEAGFPCPLGPGDVTCPPQ